MSKHIGDALRTMRRSPYQTVAAVLVLTQTFFLGYLFVMIMIGSEQVLRYFETQPQITAFFKADTTDDIAQQAQQDFEAKETVKEVKLITKEEALEKYRADNQGDPLLLQLVTADILPASLEVSAKDIKYLPQLEDDLKQLPGIDEVVFQRDVTQVLTKWTNSLRYGGAFLLSVLGITSIIQITVITGMKVSSKKKAIQTMQLLGASRWYIKAPFFFEGVFYGLIGAIFGWVSVYLGTLYLTPWLLEFLGDIPLLPVPIEFMLILLGCGSGVGVFLGGISSMFASQRYLE